MKGLFFFVLFSVFCSSVYAHPASKIALTYDSATKTVKATITHPVNNAKSHFIDKVDVALNDREIIEHRISRQDNNVGQTVKYLIPDAKSGDTIAVEAYCNLSGKLTKKITVE